MLSLFATPHLHPAFQYALDDGTPILVRPIRAEDAPRLKQGFSQLSQLARRRRGMGIDELTDAQLKELTSPDMTSHAAFGAANLEKPDEPGIGIARYQRVNGDPGAADVQITIADDYQGRGAGFVLQACLHLTAHRNGIRTLYYDVTSDNDRILKHLKLLGATHSGRADNIDRLKMPVYCRAWDVPRNNDIGKRFAETFRRLRGATAVAA